TRRSQPISRVLLRRAWPRAMTVIHLGASLPPRSCHLPADSASSVVVRLLGVAPDGGCRVSPAPRAGLTQPRSDSSLWPCSSPSPSALAATYSVWALPSILLYGARTFLPSLSREATVWLASQS